MNDRYISETRPRAVILTKPANINGHPVDTFVELDGAIAIEVWLDGVTIIIKVANHEIRIGLPWSSVNYVVY